MATKNAEVEAVNTKNHFVDKVSVELVPYNDDTVQVNVGFIRCSVLATIWQLQKLLKNVLKDQSKVVR